MAVQYTPRFGVAYWDSDNDDFSRSQLTLSHNRIEERGAIFRQDVFAQRGAATTWTRSFFYDETNEVLYFSDGTNWLKLTDFGSTVSIVAVSPTTPTADQGTSDQAARIDHRHATPPWGTTTVAVSTSAAAGTLDEFARIDHVHVLASNSVTAGKIASGAIDNENAFTAGVVKTAAIGSNAVTKEKIALDQQIPAGAIMPYAGSTAPTGWLLCNGGTHAKSAYPALWAVLSSQNYGSDTDNFLVPNFLDRIPRGAPTTGTTLGTIAGSDTVTIGAANLPNHTHSVGTLGVDNHASHVHNLNGTGASAVANSNANHSHVVAAGAGVTTNLNDGRVAIPFGSTTPLFFGGGNDPYQLLPPYWSGRPTNAGVYSADIYVLNTTATGTVAQHTTNNATGSTTHGHTIEGQSQGPTTTLTHTMTAGGVTGNPTGTVGSPLGITPKTQTVNYIIKT